MQIYYDSDADQNIAKGMEIVIIGYGSQGHAHANNLKDSGANVTVALRKESGSWAKAEAAGFDVKEVGEAVPNADLVMMLIPCLLYTSPSPRDQRGSRMPSSA